MDDALKQLRDLHLPEPPGLWPLAPGWWVLGLLLAAAAIALAIRIYRTRRRGRPLRLAVRALDRLLARQSRSAPVGTRLCRRRQRTVEARIDLRRAARRRRPADGCGLAHVSRRYCLERRVLARCRSGARASSVRPGIRPGSGGAARRCPQCAAHGREAGAAMINFLWPWAFAALPLPLIVRYLMRPRQRRDAALRVPDVGRFEAAITARGGARRGGWLRVAPCVAGMDVSARCRRASAIYR